MRRDSRLTAACGRALLELLESRRLLSAVDVLTQHNDAYRTSNNLAETTLDTSNVNVASFGRLYARAVDDQIYAQPLYVANVNIPGKGVHNVVYVATVNDSVYAFDADDASIVNPYWQDSFIDPANSIRPVFHTDVGQACGTYLDFSGNIGIVGTPVIDRATNTMYLVARTVEGTSKTFVQRLHALDLTTGAEKFGGPVVITAQVNGTGAGSSGGKVSFNPQTENQRAALALDNGNVIIAWASHCDTGPYHGWVMAYNASTLAQSWALNITANGSNGGIWQSGNGPVIDTNGDMYFAVGNGTVNPGSGQYGEAMLRISSAGQVLDYFIPSNYSTMEGNDLDFGSAGALMVPGSRTLISGDKEGKLFVLDADNLGGLHNPDRALQEFQVTPHYGSDKVHGTPVYYKDTSNNQWIYVWGSNDKLKQFGFNGTQLTSTTPVHVSNVTVNPNPSMPGGVMAVSGDGNTAGTGILWATTVLSGNANNDVRPGVLRAFDASDVSVELWNSQQNALRDDFGNLAKFNTPTVDNGRVYLPTFSNELVVYGLLAGLPAAPASLNATVTGNNVDLSWSPVTGALQYTIERRSGSGGNFIPVTTVDSSITSYHDPGLQPGTLYYYRVRAQNQNGASVPAEATATTTLAKLMAARWSFDENASTSFFDSSGNANNGTFNSSGTAWTTGRFGSALNFNGTTSAYASVPNSASLNPATQITIAAWINVTSWSGGNRRILQKGGADNEYRLTEEGGVLKFDIYQVGTVTTALPATGTWHLIVGTYDSSQVKLYIDGTEVASLATGGTIATTADQLYIGTKSPGSTAGDHFNGKIDEVRIYNYALSDEEIATLNSGSAPAMPTGLMLSATSPSTVDLSWDDNASNELGYFVERRPEAGGAYMQIATLPADSTGYSDTGLPPFTTFFYRVRAYNTFDPSAYTPEQSITTQGATIRSLVAHFNLDESSGTTLADSSGHDVVASLVGSPTHPTDTPDASAHSLGLNGSTDWAQASDNAALDMTESLTLSAWVKADAWDQTRPILEKGARETHYLLEADQGLLKFDLTNQGALTAPLPSTGVWHHLAATYDGSAMKIYIDGILAASQGASGLLGTTPEPFFIGGSHASSSTGVAFAGKIDDVRVYNYALDPTDVSAIVGNAAYLNFNEGAGPIAHDSTPNHNDGSLLNLPTWTTRVGGGTALSFAVPGQYVQLINNQNLNPTAAISISAWANPIDITATPVIAQKGAGTVQYRLYFNGPNLVFDLPGVGSVSAPAPATGSWHMLGGTYDGSTIRLWIDGQSIAGTSASGPIGTTSDPLILGAADTTGSVSDAFHGAIDDFRLFGRALTADQMQELFLTSGGTVAMNPSVTGADFVYQTSPNAITIQFSEDVTVSQAAGTMTITNLATSQPVTPVSFSYDSATHTASYTFVGALPDARYRASLLASGVTDIDDNLPLAGDFSFDFFSLAGDANHDGIVDVTDLGILATNWQTSANSFADGDFNYDGVVDVTDLGILATNWQISLPPAPSPAPALTPLVSAPIRKTTTLASARATADVLDKDPGCECHGGY